MMIAKIGVMPVNSGKTGYFTYEKTGLNKVNYNNLLQKDTVSFSGLFSKKKVKSFDPLQNYLEGAENKRKELEYECKFLNLKTDIPSKEEYEYALRMRRNKDLISEEDNKKSLAIMGRMQVAQDVLDEASLNLRYDAFCEALGEDKRHLVDKKKFFDSMEVPVYCCEELAHPDLSCNSDNEYINDVIRKAVDKDPDDIRRWPEEGQLKAKYIFLFAAKFLGIKNPDPSFKEVQKKSDAYFMGFVKEGIFPKESFKLCCR